MSGRLFRDWDASEPFKRTFGVILFFPAPSAALPRTHSGEGPSDPRKATEELMTSRELFRGQLKELRDERRLGLFATLSLALFGFLVGESYGEGSEPECSDCGGVSEAERCAAVSIYNSREALSALSNGVPAPVHDPWLVEAGWSGAYYAPLY